MDLSGHFRDGRAPQGKPATGVATADEGISELQLRWRDALVLWLQWNRAYEHVTQHMFDARQDLSELQTLMDRADRLRSEAIALSRELLD